MMVSTTGLDLVQQSALDYPLDGPLLALVGSAGTGKSFALLQRAARAAKAGAVLLSAANESGTARLREQCAVAGVAPELACRDLGELAFDILGEYRAAHGGPAPERIDDARAAAIFQAVGAALFSLEWDEFLIDAIDPEIAGLRAPERFADAAFRLIRRLRSALVSPDEFRRSAFRGATSFYAKPPNLASADILAATKSEHRDSLRADATELARQHAREVDLIKILARLYGSYLESLTAHGCLTVTDAVYEAVAALRADAALAKRVRSRFPVALVDDAQDLTAGKIALLEAIYGKVLSGVTLAGDPEQSTLDFAGARGNATLASATQRLEFATQYRSPAGILRAAALARDPNDARTVEIPRETATELYRAESIDDEARYVAETIATLLARGERPEQIAVVTRSLHCANAVTKALLARNVPLDVAGAANLYAFPAVADGLAALWALADPYRHDWLSRNLEAPWLALSDASIATLCGEVPEAQPLLFELPDDEVDETRSRWDRRRDLRLGRNLTRGDADSLLPDEARERVVAFRSARLRWERLERELDLPALCATILGETVLAATRDDARGRFERGLIARLLDEIERFAASRPLATLDDFLAAVEEVSAAESDLLAIAPQPGNHGGCVRLLDVETAKGREFNHLFIIGASAGSFPRYYVPDGFMYSPSLGIAPKENVGDDARAARTAKFSYVFYKLKVRDKYNAQERRAFACAATRARVRLYVSAAGRATRGVAAPEILAELQEAHAGD